VEIRSGGGERERGHRNRPGTADLHGRRRGARRRSWFRAYGPPLSETRAWGERGDQGELTKGVFVGEGGTAVVGRSVRRTAMAATRAARVWCRHGAQARVALALRLGRRAARHGRYL